MSSAPEEPARPLWLIQGVAILALAWGGVYLTWRIGWTWRDSNPWLYGLLLGAELVGFASLCFYVLLAWRTSECEPPPVTTMRTVDVLVPTYDEAVDVLRATLLGCNAIRHPHETWLLDDGRRATVRDLAEELGVHYVTRPDNSHAEGRQHQPRAASARRRTAGGARRRSRTAARLPRRDGRSLR